MTKRLSLVLASITLAIVCGYFLTGKLIQQNYYQTIAKLNAQPNIKIKLINYKRGLFVSSAELTIELGADNLSDAQIIPLKQVITHGPLIVANTPNGRSIKILAGQIKTNLSEPLASHFDQFIGHKDPLSIVTLISFGKEANTWIRLGATDQTTPTDFHVALDPIHGIIKHDLNFSTYHGTLSLAKLQMNNLEWKFNLENIALHLDANALDTNYISSNLLTAKTIAFNKDGKDVVKFNDINAKLAFTTTDNNIGLDCEASVALAQIVDQRFENDTIKLHANNLNRSTLANIPRLNTLSAKATVDLLQELTVASTDLTLELPKNFTETLIAYISFEIYRASYLGRFDTRPAPAVLQDISGSINKLVQGAVKKELFIDKGTHYALNSNRSPQS